MKIKLIYYKMRKPPVSGQYLWFSNYWVENVDEDYTMRQDVEILTYEDGGWHDAQRNFYYDPDFWAEIPLPKAPPKPANI